MTTVKLAMNVRSFYYDDEVASTFGKVTTLNSGIIHCSNHWFGEHTFSKFCQNNGFKFWPNDFF